MNRERNERERNEQIDRDIIQIEKDIKLDTETDEILAEIVEQIQKKMNKDDKLLSIVDRLEKTEKDKQDKLKKEFMNRLKVIVKEEKAKDKKADEFRLETIFRQIEIGNVLLAEERENEKELKRNRIKLSLELNKRIKERQEKEQQEKESRPPPPKRAPPFNPDKIKELQDNRKEVRVLFNQELNKNVNSINDFKNIIKSHTKQINQDEKRLKSNRSFMSKQAIEEVENRLVETKSIVRGQQEEISRLKKLNKEIKKEKKKELDKLDKEISTGDISLRR